MAECEYYTICWLKDEYDPEANRCILHSHKPQKDQQAFDEALTRHRQTRGELFAWMVFSNTVDFSDATFSQSADFSHATFSKNVKFIHTTFSQGATFSQATFFQEADFTWATFSQSVTFSRATFSHAYEVTFFKATFPTGADFSATTFEPFKIISRGDDLKGADFTDAILVEADFRDAVLPGTTFHSAILEGAKFRKADLDRTNFTAAQLAGANFLGANLDRTNFGGADLRETSLQGMDVRTAHIRHAKLRNAHLQGADLTGTELQNADLTEANLQGACLRGANLQEACFEKANLCGVYARFAIVDGTTLLSDCDIDRETDFANVGLDNARIEGRLKAILKRNIRKHHWKGHRYQYKKWKVPPEELVNDPCREPLIHKGRYRENPWLWLAWPILWASDYGSSGLRLAGLFVGFTLLFAAIYLIPTPALPWVPSWLTCEFAQPWVTGLDSIKQGDKEEVPLSFGWRVVRSLYFSLTIMTALGFDEVSPYPKCFLGYLLVGLQVIIGYGLLGALITRLAVLFQEVE